MSLTDEQIVDIAKRIGASSVRKLKGGSFSKLHIAVRAHNQFGMPRQGGRSTDPTWTVKRLVSMTGATGARLRHIAKAINATAGLRLSYMQVAALLLEMALEEAEK